MVFFLHASASNYGSAILSKEASLGEKLFILFYVPLIVGVKKMAFIMVDMAFGLSMVTDLLTSEAYFCIHPTYCGLE